MKKDSEKELPFLSNRVKGCEKIESSLRESEERFRTLVEHIPAVTYISALDKNSTILYVSPQVKQILAFSPEEYKADPDLWRRQIHPEDHDRVMAELVSSRVADRNFVSEYRKIAKDGRTVWLHDEAVTVKDPGNKPLFLQGVMYDITSQKLAEKALENAFSELEKRVTQRTQELNRTNENLRQEVAERRRAEKAASKLASFPILAPVPIVEIDNTGKITYINPVGVRLFSDILTGGTEHPFLKGIEAVAQRLKEEDKSSLAREVEIGGVWYLQSVFRVDNEGVRIYSIDITERKRFEQARRESEQELKAIVQGSPMPQYVLDKEHRVIYWNKALEKYTGIPAQQVIGTTKQWSAFYNYQRPTMVDLVIDNNERAISQWYPGKFSKSKLIEHGYEAIDFFPRLGEHGSWLRFTAAPIYDSNGNVIGAVETYIDITELKQKEQALKQSEERFRMVANYVYDWEYFINSEKKLIYTTPSCEHFTGYRPEDFYNNSGLLQKIVHPDDRKLYLDHMAFVSEKMGEASFELRIIRKDGRELWVNHICHPVFDDAGHWVGRRISNTDIEKQKLLEERLKTLEEEYDRMTESIPGAVFTRTEREDQRLESVSDGIRSLTGFAPEDFLSRKVSFEQLVLDEDRQKVVAARRQAVQREEGYEVSYRIRDAKGSLKSVLEKGRPAKETSGKAVLEGVLFEAGKIR